MAAEAVAGIAEVITHTVDIAGVTIPLDYLQEGGFICGLEVVIIAAVAEDSTHLSDCIMVSPIESIVATTFPTLDIVATTFLTPDITGFILPTVAIAFGIPGSAVIV